MFSFYFIENEQIKKAINLINIKVYYVNSLFYSKGMSYLISELGNFKDFYQALIDLAKEGKVAEAMDFLEESNPELYLKQGKKLENRLIDVYKESKLL